MLETISKFKETPIGKIPVDWEVKKLGEIISNAKLGGNYENSENNEGVPVIKMGNIGRGNINISKIQNLPFDEKYNEYDVLRKGDLLFNTRNTLDLVGKVAIWNNELPFALYNSNLLKLAFKTEFVSDNSFMNYSLNSNRSLVQLRGFATGTTSVAAIYGRDLNHLKIPLPPLPEQQKIAEILSTWDKAIQETSSIIKNLEKRNKALAFSLLRGKLSNGKIKELPLSKFLTHTPREIDKPIANYLALGIRSHGKGIFHKPDSDPKAIAMEKLFEVKENDFIVNITFAWEHAVAIISKRDEGGLVSHRFPTYVINNMIISTEYFRHYILQPFFKHMLDNISPGGAGRNRVLSKKDLMKLKIEVPTLEEQSKIAEMLNTANKELQQYLQKLNNLKTQKKGLMQQLLTGKVRTV